MRVAVVHPFGSAGGAGRREIDPIFIEVVLHDRDGGRAAGREVLAVDNAVVVKAHAHLRSGLVDGEVRFAIFFAFKCIGAETFNFFLAVLLAFTIGICHGDVAGLVRCRDAQRVVVTIADVAVHAAVLIRAGPRGDRLFSFASAGVLPRITVKLRRIAVFVLDRRLDRDVADAALVGVLHRSGQGVDAVLRNRFAFLKDHVLAAFKQLVRNLDVDRALLCIVGVFFGFLREDRMHVRRVHVVLDLVGGGSGLVSGSVRCMNLQRVYAVIVEVILVIYGQNGRILMVGKTRFAVHRGLVLRVARPPQLVAQGIRRCALAAFRDDQALQDVVVAVVPAVSLTGSQICSILRHSRHRRHVQIVLDVNRNFLGVKRLRDVNVIGFLIQGSVSILGSGCFLNRRRDCHRKLNRRVARDFIFSILSNCSSDREGFRLTGILTGNNLFVFCCFSVFCFYSCSYYHTVFCVELERLPVIGIADAILNSVLVGILCLSPFFQPSRQRAFVPLHVKIDLLDPDGISILCFLRVCFLSTRVTIRVLGRRGDEHGNTVVRAVENAKVGQLLCAFDLVDILRARADFVPDNHMQVTREVVIFRAGDPPMRKVFCHSRPFVCYYLSLRFCLLRILRIQHDLAVIIQHQCRVIL